MPMLAAWTDIRTELWEISGAGLSCTWPKALDDRHSIASWPSHRRRILPRVTLARSVLGLRKGRAHQHGPLIIFLYLRCHTLHPSTTTYSVHMWMQRSTYVCLDVSRVPGTRSSLPAAALFTCPFPRRAPYCVTSPHLVLERYKTNVR